MTVASATGWSVANGPTIATIAKGTATEAKVKITAIAGTTFTIVQPFGLGGAAFTHSAGATVDHTISGDDMDGFNTLAALADAKGDLPVGTAADTFGRLPVGANDTILMADSVTSTGLKWAAAATTTEIADIAATEAAGTSDTWARGDHVHAHPDLTGSALGHTKFVRKTADETVNNSATLQNDDTLLFAVAANEVWAFQFILIHVGNATADIKFAFTVPTAGTLAWALANNFTSDADIGAGSVIDTSGTALGIHAFTAKSMSLLTGIVANGANAGNCQLQWAQNVATVVDTKVSANSYLMAWRIG